MKIIKIEMLKLPKTMREFRAGDDFLGCRFCASSPSPYRILRPSASDKHQAKAR